MLSTTPAALVKKMLVKKMSPSNVKNVPLQSWWKLRKRGYPHPRQAHFLKLGCGVDMEFLLFFICVHRFSLMLRGFDAFVLISIICCCFLLMFIDFDGFR